MLEWLEPFCLVAKKRRRAGDPLPVVHDVPADDWHNVQTRYEADIESIFVRFRSQCSSLDLDGCERSEEAGAGVATALPRSSESSSSVIALSQRRLHL